uniref:Uncharacterized protein n=1 Tax=Leersia perrieri TaxID=77586 RepID=A0A0D9WSE4_9ORYZ
MHQIGSGMYVSGPAPDRRKERRLSSGSVATPPYTGGDVSRSGELGRMFDVSAAPSPASSRRSSGPLPRPIPSPAFFRRLPDTVFDQSDMPIGELVKITGQVTCGHQPFGAHFHNAARCVFTSVQLYERHGCCFRWKQRHSEARTANFYISDRITGRRFYVRAGESAKITWMIKPKTISFDGERKGASRELKSWMASNDLSCDGIVRVKEGFIREGDTASVIGVLKKHHTYDIIDASSGAITTGCQLTRCMFPVLVEGLILIGDEDPDEDNRHYWWWRSRRAAKEEEEDEDARHELPLEGHEEDESDDDDDEEEDEGHPSMDPSDKASAGRFG